MSNAPQFRLRSVLILSAVVAFALLALVRPSVVWLVLLPPLISIVSVFAVVRAITTPRERMFWASFMAGVAAFAMSVGFIDLMSALVGGPQTVSQSVGRWAWQIIHGESVALPGSTRRLPPEFASFLVSLYVIFAVLFSASATLVAQLLMRERKQDS